MPVLDLLDALWAHYMNTRFERKQTTQALFDSDNGEDYTKFSLKTLTESLGNSQLRQVYLADQSHGQVHNFSGKNYIVDLTKPTYACGGFQDKRYTMHVDIL